MFCQNCGAHNSESAKYCRRCGARLVHEPKSSASGAPSDTAPLPSLSALDGADSASAGRGRDEKGARGGAPRLLAITGLALSIIALACIGLVFLAPRATAPIAQPQQEQEGAVDDASGETDDVDGASTSQEAETQGDSQQDADVSTEPERESQQKEEPRQDAEATTTAETDQQQERSPQETQETATDPDDPEGSRADDLPDATAGYYVLPDSSTRLYTVDELSGMSNWQLYLARNEIYARHGRQFSNADLQGYFADRPWYDPSVPAAEFDAHSSEILNDFEKRNAETILSIEKERGSIYI